MRRLFILVGFLFCAACSDAPLAPTPAPVPTQSPAPASLTITASDATSVNQSLVNVAVLDANGNGVAGETVFLSTTSGTLNPTSVLTGPTGRGQALLTTTRGATLTAQARSFTVTTTAAAYSRPFSVTATVSLSAPNKGDGVTFSASVTGGAEPYTYAWTFGDGATGSGQTTTHRYFSDGAKQIGLTVTDADGRTGSTSASVSVQSDPPPAAPPVTPPAPSLSVTLTCTAAAAGSPSPCNVSASYDGVTLLGTAITDADWDWGDGLETLDVASPLATHSYGQAGVFPVFVTVTANTSAGSKQASASTSLEIP